METLGPDLAPALHAFSEGAALIRSKAASIADSENLVILDLSLLVRRCLCLARQTNQLLSLRLVFADRS